MPWKFNPKLHKKFHEKDRFYGTTTVGTKGQVVIPVEAREELKIKPGDQLVVMGKFGKVLGLMKVDQMQEFVKMIMKHVTGTSMEEEVKKRIEKTLGSI